MESIIGWSVALIALLVVAGVLIVWFRKRFSVQDPTSSGGFTLGDLRELHRAGKMTDAEFEAAKGLVLKGLKASMEEPKKKPGASKSGKTP